MAPKICHQATQIFVLSLLGAHTEKSLSTGKTSVKHQVNGQNNESKNLSTPVNCNTWLWTLNKAKKAYEKKREDCLFFLNSRGQTNGKYKDGFHWLNSKKGQTMFVEKL